HGGGKRLDVGSLEHALLCRWIADGARLDAPDRSRVTKLTVTPAQRNGKSGEKYTLRVEAAFADGSTQDVTALCSYESLDKQVAAVDPNGQVTITGPGDAAIMVRFRADPAVAQVLVPRDGKDAFPEFEPRNFIDKHVLTRLQRLNVPPSPL